MSPFPNGMVDRITPATGPRERAHGRKPSGWTIPSRSPASRFANGCSRITFPQGRPPLEKVGVTLTPHVHAYEAMKIRILNGGHAT